MRCLSPPEGHVPHAHRPAVPALPGQDPVLYIQAGAGQEEAAGAPPISAVRVGSGGVPVFTKRAKVRRLLIVCGALYTPKISLADPLTLHRPLWLDDTAIFSLHTGRTPISLGTDAGGYHDHHLSMESMDVGSGTLPAWHCIDASAHLDVDPVQPPALALPSDELIDAFRFHLPGESYDSPEPPFVEVPSAGRPSPCDQSPRHIRSVCEHSPGLSMSTERSIGSPRSPAFASVPRAQTPTLEQEPFTTQGSLEVLPDAFSFYIGPTGVSDALLLQREPYGAGGVAPASVKGLQYRRVAQPAGTETRSDTLNESVGESGPVLFGITDHALLHKAEPKPDATASKHAWSTLWQMVDAATAWSLMQLYTRFVDPYFPIISPHQLPTSPDELMSPSSSSSGKSRMSLALLTAMCAAALPFVVHDRSLYALLLRPLSSDELYRLCWLGVTQELHGPTLSTLQACLLLQQRLPTNLYLHDTAFSWSLMATAVSVGQTMGLHRDPTGWTAVPAWERRLRRRLWWTLWTTETWVALARGMPRHLGRTDDDEDTDVQPLGREDMVAGDTLSWNDGASSDNNVNTGATRRQPYLLHLVSLTTILADIQRAYYTLRAMRRTSRHLARAMAVGRPLHARLQAWRDALPDGLRFRSRPSRLTINSILTNKHQDECGADSSSGGNRASMPNNVEQPPQYLDGNASLHLSYLVTHMMLFRALLRPLDDGGGQQGGSEGNSPAGTSNSIANGNGNSTDTCGDSADTDDGARNQAVTRGALLCVREFVEFVESLTPTHWNAFWHGWSRANFAMAGSFIVYLLHVVTMRRPSVPGDGKGPRGSQGGQGGTPVPRGVCARPGFEEEYRELLAWIRRWRWASRVSVHGGAGAKGLTNLMLLRVETFLGELGGLGELKDQ